MRRRLAWGSAAKSNATLLTGLSPLFDPAEQHQGLMMSSRRASDYPIELSHISSQESTTMNSKELSALLHST